MSDGILTQLLARLARANGERNIRVVKRFEEQAGGEEQLIAWVRELDGLYDVAQQAFDTPGKWDEYRRLDARYKKRLKEINGQLSHFAFQRDNEYEGSHILIPKKEQASDE